MSVIAKALSIPQAEFGGTDNTQKIVRYYVTLTPSGNYAALGDVLDFTANLVIHSGFAPVFAKFESALATGASGYEYKYLPGTTSANGKFQVLTTPNGGGPMTDLGAEAYPAGILADNIIGYVDFARL